MNEETDTRISFSTPRHISSLQDLVANLVEEELLKLKLAAGPSAPASPSSPAPPAGPAYETSLQ